jgi:aerobic C4-dicarboxylate transport protein
MSEARAITNLIGNGVAAVVVSKWEHELDVDRARAVLANVTTVEAEEYAAGRVEPEAAVSAMPPPSRLGPPGEIEHRV